MPIWITICRLWFFVEPNSITYTSVQEYSTSTENPNDSICRIEKSGFDAIEIETLEADCCQPHLPLISGSVK